MALNKNKPPPRSALEPGVSLKGLDDFSRKFLVGDTRAEDEGQEFVRITKSEGSKVSDAALDNYYKQRKVEFIRRAGQLAEDLIAFVVEQKKIHNLSDEEAIFGIALANINFRNAYGSPQGNEKQLSAADREKMLERFDEVCWGAQQYFDANS